MNAVYKRELRSYFRSMTGYVFIALFTAFTGVYFMIFNLQNGFPYFARTLSSVISVFLFTVPLLTMRSMAEDRRNRTDQLWLTSPVSVGRVVLGKFFAMATVFAVPTAVLALCPLIIGATGNWFPKTDYATLLAFFLLGCVYIAIGMFLSSLTESQVIAAVGTFGVLLLLNLWDTLTRFLPQSAFGSFVGFLGVALLLCGLIWAITHSGVATTYTGVISAAALLGVYLVKPSLLAGALPALLGKFSLMTTFANFYAYDLFDIAGLVTYLSIIALFVFFTVQSVQKRRWS